jgi:hypothetical protein
MKIAITLNKNIECEYICQQIQKLVSKFQQSGEDLSQSILVIDLVKITDGGDNHILKLEYNKNIV